MHRLTETDRETTMSGTPNQKAETDVNEVVQEIVPVQDGKRPKLSIDVPPRSISSSFLQIDTPPVSGSAASSRSNVFPVFGSGSRKMAISPHPSSSSKDRLSTKSLLSGLSFKFRSSSSEVGRVDAQTPEGSSRGRNEKASLFSSFSITKLFSPKIKRTSSLPIKTIAAMSDSSHGGSMNSTFMDKKEFQHHISRSLSVPCDIENSKLRSMKRMNSLGGVFRVVPSTPRVTEKSNVISENITPAEPEMTDDGEDIPEEEAVCRICMIELCEDSDTLKLECSCKGELALAHEECAVKWFSIKGNRNCEVCKQEVQNLPVTLLRIQAAQTAVARSGNHDTMFYPYRFWQDMPILVMVSMLAYFCFLEQLLVATNGTAALALSLPFSCILGLFASMTSSSMVMKRFIWVYATIQFLLVVFFAHLFYSYLHMQAVISIVLATFSGFGVAMCGNTIIVEILRCRRRSLLASTVQRSQEGMASSHPGG